MKIGDKCTIISNSYELSESGDEFTGVRHAYSVGEVIEIIPYPEGFKLEFDLNCIVFHCKNSNGLEQFVLQRELELLTKIEENV